jgi:hypothetical protein
MFLRLRCRRSTSSRLRVILSSASAPTTVVRRRSPRRVRCLRRLMRKRLVRKLAPRLRHVLKHGPRLRLVLKHDQRRKPGLLLRRVQKHGPHRSHVRRLRLVLKRGQLLSRILHRSRSRTRLLNRSTKKSPRDAAAKPQSQRKRQPALTARAVLSCTNPLQLAANPQGQFFIHWKGRDRISPVSVVLAFGSHGVSRQDALFPLGRQLARKQ